MPLPMLLPLLLGGASIGANYIGNQKAQNATAGAMAAERRRQNKLDEESYALNAAARDRYQGAESQVADKSAELSDMYTEALSQPASRPQAIAPQSDSSVIQNIDATTAESARADGQDRARRLGEFRGFGDFMGDAMRGQARDAGQLGMLGGFKRGSQGVLPLELEGAATKGQGWMMLGDLLNMASGMTLNKALMAPGAMGWMTGAR